MADDRAGRVALVSGGNRGIGLAVVDGLAAAGVRVFMGARDAAAGRKAALGLQEQRAQGAERKPAGEVPQGTDGKPAGEVHVVALDVSDQDSVDAAIAEVQARAGRLDVLVNNAGVMGDAGVAATEPDLELMHDVLETNLFGAWRLSVAALPLLRRAPHGQIISVSSGMGQLSDMGGGAPGYRLSKAGLSVLTRTFAAELRGAVKVNVVCPGWVRTDMGGPHARRSVQEGADTIVWLATLPDSEVPDNQFLRDCRPIDW